MITRTLLERIFSAASIERWNDHPHPAVFTELGKQAHKMVTAWVLGKTEEAGCAAKGHPAAVDWDALIWGGIFDFLYRVVVTDIRPPVFHKLIRDRETKEQLDAWVASRLEPEMSADMFRAFRDHLRAAGQDCSLERRILEAAHYMATNWEFSFILHWSANMYGVDRTKRDIERNLSDITLPSAREILDGRAPDLAGFLSLVGQLTFQKRWAQTPRVPQTSVLGHLMFVAVVSRLLSQEMDLCPRRRYNNFFGGLFHDLPEVLTRDIISPVKASVEGLDALIRKYEHEAMDERILPLLPEGWREELRWYTEEEFTNKTHGHNTIDPVQRHDGDIPPELNDDRFNPVDGRLIEFCDKLAAYIEASVSLRTGIRSPALEDGRESMYRRFKGAVINGIPLGYMFEYFR